MGRNSPAILLGNGRPRELLPIFHAYGLQRVDRLRLEEIMETTKNLPGSLGYNTSEPAFGSDLQKDLDELKNRGLIIKAITVHDHNTYNEFWMLSDAVRNSIASADFPTDKKTYSSAVEKSMNALSQDSRFSSKYDKAVMKKRAAESGLC